MAEFRPAFEFMMDHEDYKRSGVITGEPHGGRARWGINSLAHPDVDLDAMDTADKARAWYDAETWRTGPFPQLSNQLVANKYYDMTINMGLRQATKLVQRALLAADMKVMVTGLCDAPTSAALDTADSGILLYRMRDQCAKYYISLAEKNPAAYGRWLTGWLRRASC